MNPSLRNLVRRVGPSPASPSIDDAFVVRVRERLEPIVVPAGFAFVRADAGTRDENRPARATVVRFEADAEPFVARYPGTAGHLRTEGSPLELWAEFDADRGGTRFGFESWHLSALLAVVRAGPGAPPRRRRLDDDTVDSLAPGPALDRATDLLRRLFDAAAER